MLGKLLQMMDAEGHQHGRHDVEARLQVVRLVVEEDVRPDALRNGCLSRPSSRKSSAALMPKLFSVVIRRSSLGAPRAVTMEMRTAGSKYGSAAPLWL